MRQLFHQPKMNIWVFLATIKKKNIRMKSFVNKVMKKIETVVKCIILCLIVLNVFSCKKQEAGSSPKLDSVDKTIMVYLRDNPNYSILTEALDTIGLSGILNLYGSMTMFAPSNEAFAKFFKRKGISGLTGINRDDLVKILRNHLYNQKFVSGNFQTGSLPAVTASGDLIKMDISKGIKNTYLNNTVKIDTIDIAATNGIVHVVFIGVNTIGIRMPCIDSELQKKIVKIPYGRNFPLLDAVPLRIICHTIVLVRPDLIVQPAPV